MKINLLMLFVFLVIIVTPVMAQEDDCVEMDIEIESTKNLGWTTCYMEEYASLVIKTSSEESTDIKIILQKDPFWDGDVNCFPPRLLTLINGVENNQQEKDYGNYIIISISLEKGENEIEIVNDLGLGSSNEYCLPVPEPGPICPAGTILMMDSCVISNGTCTEGTTYKNGICQVNEIENRTKSSSEKWINVNECWYIDDDGNKVPCTIDGGTGLPVFFSIVFGTCIVAVIAAGVMVIRRKRK